MIAVLAVLGALAVLLAVPVGVAFRVERVEALAGEVAIRWMFGLVRFRIPLRRTPGRPARPAPGPQRVRERRRRSAGDAVAVLRDPALRARVLRLARDLVRAAHVTGLRVRMRLGLGDPADTGMLWAVLGPLGALVGAGRGADVRIEPEFLDAALELDARGRVRVVPLQLLALAAAFALSPASIRAWRTLRRDRP